jgi:magnesium and cobalt exporter, CNNM family
MDTTMEVLIALALVAANGFFVASEFAIVKMRPTRLSELAGRGNRRARTALQISRHLDAYLSANQLGITVASLALGWIGEEAFAHALEPIVGPAAVVHPVAVALSFVIITFLHTVVGELAPKSLAIQRTEPVALWTAVPLRAFYVVAFPAIWLLNTASGLVLRLLRLPRATEVETIHSPDEMRMILSHVTLEPSARRLIDRVFDYTHHLARHAMTLRGDVAVLSTARSFDENLATVLAEKYTRYPLVGPDDAIVGYVHLKDLFAALAAGQEPDLRTLARPALMFSEDTPLEEIRRAIQQRGAHLVVVTGEGSAFSGILTLEDLVEEFVGEIRDEQDESEVPPLVRGEGRAFEADGRLTLDVLVREVGFALAPDERDVETLGGFMMARLGRIPAAGDRVSAGGFRLTVVAMTGRRVARVRGEPVEVRAQ